MRIILSLLVLGIILSSCTAPEPTVPAPPEPAATGPTPAPTFAIPPRLATQAARQRSTWDSAAGNPSVSSDSSVSSKPPVQVPTPAPIPTIALIPTFAPVFATPEINRADTPRPTATPIIIHTFGDLEWFKGRAAIAFGAGESALETGDYRKAILHFEDALKLHGKPSPKAENKIGLAYMGLEEWNQASRHFSNAIALDDNPLDRINRGRSYFESDQCDLAIADGKTALQMEPGFKPGFHSDAEAHLLLASCYAWTGVWSSERQHLDAAITIAKEHGYRTGRIAAIVAWRNEIPES